MRAEEILDRFKKVKKCGNGWNAICPGHEDGTASLSISDGEKGIVFHCHAGCPPERICQAVELKMEDLFYAKGNGNGRYHQPDLTLAALANDKGLPASFLQEAFGLREVTRAEAEKELGLKMAGVQIPYRDTNCNTNIRQRLRTATTPKFVWAKGDGKLIPYGLWLPKQDFLILVEGESDTWTLHYHDFPVLGIPGADMVKILELPHIAHATEIFAVDEKDQGGKTFIPKLEERLKSVGWKGKFYTIKMPEGCKDPNDLHRKDEKAFKEVMQKILDDYREETRQITKPKPDTFPLQVFPQELQDYCRAFAESLIVPIDFVACSLLPIAGVLIGSKTEIEINLDWYEKPALYLGLVGESGSCKTPTIKKNMAVIFEIEKEMAEQNELAEENYQAALMDYKADSSTWEAQRKKGVAVDKPEKPEKPPEQTIFSSDFTVEVIAEMLGDNPHGLLLYKDELTSWINSLNQYKGGRGSDREFFLSGWSGTPTKVDRKSGHKYIPNPFIGVLGGIVPDNLSIFQNPVNNAQDGFIDRVLFSYPESIQRKYSDKRVPLAIKDRAKELLRSLYNNPGKEEVIRLDMGANCNFASKFDLIQYAMQDAPTNLKAFLSKLPSHVARFALILTRLHRQTICNAQIMDWACLLGDYFQSHFQKTIVDSETPKEEKATNRVYEWIKIKELTKIKTRDLLTWRIARNSPAAKQKLQELVELGLAKWLTVNKEIEIC